MRVQSAGPCSRNTSSCSSALIIARAGRVCRMISSSPIWDWLSSCVPAFSVCSTMTDTVRSCDPSCVCSTQSLRPTPLFRVYALPAPASIRRPSNLSRLQKSNLHAFLTAHSSSGSTNCNISERKGAWPAGFDSCTGTVSKTTVARTEKRSPPIYIPSSVESSVIRVKNKICAAHSILVASNCRWTVLDTPGPTNGY